MYYGQGENKMSPSEGETYIYHVFLHNEAEGHYKLV